MVNATDTRWSAEAARRGVTGPVLEWVVRMYVVRSAVRIMLSVDGLLSAGQAWFGEETLNVMLM